MKRYHPEIYILAFVIILAGCSARKETIFSGHTMGTTYRVKVVGGYFQSTGGLQEKIDRRLKAINQSMSTYLADSEISKFNGIKKAGTRFEISNDFLQVMRVAAYIYRLSDGAWDGTVDPLVNLWGFGRKDGGGTIPDNQLIYKLLKNVGFDYIKMLDDRYLLKTNPSVTLDLGSIAKGFGVDRIAELIKTQGFKDFLVEIGGEVYAAGFRKDGRPWRVGVNRPQKDAPVDQVYKVVPLSDKAMATSGDYRSFYEINGKRYSHVIDPRTGRPVANGVVSASVIADNCTFADGLATAIMVMGHAKGLALVNRLDGVECLIVVRQADHTLQDYYSRGFATEN
jgi:thiamine biosynthesis lipoprotein